jgi:hypothetical protein
MGSEDLMGRVRALRARAMPPNRSPLPWACRRQPLLPSLGPSPQPTKQAPPNASSSVLGEPGVEPGLTVQGTRSGPMSTPPTPAPKAW